MPVTIQGVTRINGSLRFELSDGNTFYKTDEEMEKTVGRLSLDPDSILKRFVLDLKKKNTDYLSAPALDLELKNKEVAP